MNMNTTYEYEKTVLVTVSDIYNSNGIKPPKGFKLTGEFRPPKAGEHFLTSPDGRVDCACLDYIITLPRLILTEAPVRKQYIFTETDQYRHLKKGDWYLAENFENQPFYACHDDETYGPRRILTLEIREIQEP